LSIATYVRDCGYARELQLVHNRTGRLLAARAPKRPAGRPEKG
jgi:hypothetical protein